MFWDDNKIITFSHCFRKIQLDWYMRSYEHNGGMGVIKNYWNFDELPSRENCSRVISIQFIAFGYILEYMGYKLS